MNLMYNYGVSANSKCNQAMAGGICEVMGMRQSYKVWMGNVWHTPTQFTPCKYY